VAAILNMPGPGVVRNVQALRGLAALLVIFVHLETVLPRVGLVQFGGGGVDIFFVISGFIMVYTTMHRDVTPISFISDRIARIVPIYWIVTLAVFGLVLVSPTLVQTTRADWGELAKSLTFIPFQKNNGLVAPVLFVGWTLNYEMFFYLLFALGLALPGKKAGPLAVICCLAFLAGAGLVEHPQSVFGKFYTDTVVLDFALGVVIGLTHSKMPLQATMSNKVAVASLVVTGIILALVLPLIFPEVSTFIVGGLPACLIVAGALTLERWGWVVKAAWGLAMGNASYSIYLTHTFVTETTQKLAAKVQPGAFGSSLLIAATLIAVCVVGILVHQTLEQPLSTVARRLLKARRLNPQMDRFIAMDAVGQGSPTDVHYPTGETRQASSGL
jgi:peptidoglycan/LPS O-acetylase OafA/YrhL